jgi:Spy/CpxP family protein refolding chaperone
MNMKKLVVLGLAVLLASPVAAQQRDTMNAQRDTAEAGRLRAQIEQRFNDRVTQDLNLNADQATKLRATQERFGARRRDVMQQQLARRQALENQMQPGIAANSDSVRKLMDGIQAGRAEMVKIEQDQDREMAGYLTPVQRARYQQMRERLMQRVGEMRMERREGRGFGRGQGVSPRRPAIRGGARRRGI